MTINRGEFNRLAELVDDQHTEMAERTVLKPNFDAIKAVLDLIGTCLDELALDPAGLSGTLIRTTNLQQIINTMDALRAEDIPNDAAGNLTSTNVQAALEELQVAIDGISTGGGGPSTASELPSVARNGLSATDVQAALEELHAEFTAGLSGGPGPPASQTRNPAEIAEHARYHY